MPQVFFHKKWTAFCVFSLLCCSGVAKVRHAQRMHSALQIKKVASLPRALLESSGLVWVKGRLWTMSDEHDPRLYALSPKTGKVVRTVFLKGVRNRDWESLAVDNRYFYVGDIGNNLGKRDSLVVYRFALARLNQKRIRVRDRFMYRYPHYKPSSNRQWYHDYDAEAMMSLKRHLYIFTKNWRSGNSDLYRLPEKPGVHIAAPVMTVSVHGMVTAVDHSAQQVVLLSYPLPLLGFHVYLSQVKRSRLFNGAAPDLKRYYLSLHCQAEGLALHRNQAWITCEGRRGFSSAVLYHAVLPVD